MRRNPCSAWTDQRGIVLVMALILMGLLSALVGAYAILVRADIGIRGGAGRARKAFYAAEAGLNVAMAETRNMFDNFAVPTAYSNVVTVGTGSQQRTVGYSLSPDPTCNPCPTQSIPAGQPFAGLNTIPYRYTVSSVAENTEGDQETELGAEFEVHNIPIFQFLAFYANDLYIMPAPTMSLAGRVHTNGDMYLNANNGATLSIGDKQPQMPFVQVSAAGNIFRGGYKDYTGQICTGTVIVDRLADTAPPSPDLDPLTLSCVGNGGSPVPQTTLSGYLGSMLAGVNAMQTPNMNSIARGGADAVYWERADLRIVLRLDLPRAAINFGAAGLCPAQAGVRPIAPASPALFPIEVQSSNGSRDTAKTNALWRFMCERRGAIFYNDIPNGAVAGTSNDALAANRNNYTPAFGGTTNDRVYRRVGEDTNGDGIVDTTINGAISNSDRNRDICPISINNPKPAAATRPWWVMEDCPWPYEILGTAVGQSGSATQTNGTGDDAPVSSWFQDMDYRRGGFYNRREGKWIYLLNVNLRALIDWNEFNGGPLFAPNDSSDGGLVVFLSVQGPSSSAAANNYGVRIFDSADLNTRGGTFPWPAPADPTGLTVVSDQAVYIEGNYNKTHQYPAAVIGDAINVLSQGWEVPAAGPLPNDRKSLSSSLATRDVPAADGTTGSGAGCGVGGCASFTTNTALGVNAAFISGIGPAPDGDGVYNGGLENYPRFHESWTNFRLNYLGSFVSLGLPRHQKNDWACGSGSPCNIYDPPDRFWDYDTAFNNVAWLPPLTPRVTYVEQRLYTRFYK